MTQPSYNLIREPWIPVVRADGIVTELGLREVLLQAHALRGLSGETPLVTAALHRLLLAILYAALGMPSTDAWEDLWAQGRFPEEQVTAYLSRWQERFDLFHPERPFLQWDAPQGRLKSVVHLVPHMASGNNPVLFDHHHEGQEVALTPAEAARALLAGLCFALSGGLGIAAKNAKDAPWARGVIFLAEGDTLFETLMFNYLPRRHWTVPFIDPDKDRPFWEADDPFKPSRRQPLGVLDYLTWPSRSVRLLPKELDGTWVVSQVILASGLDMEVPGQHWRDPYKHYTVKKGKRSGYVALRFGGQRRGRGSKRDQGFEDYRALWRDSVVLLQLGSDAEHPPRPVAWLADLAQEGVLPRAARLRLMALGMANDQAKIEFYREEHLPLPPDYLRDPEMVSQLSQALTLAEQVGGQVLGRALHRLATLLLSTNAEDPNGRKPDREKVSNLVGHWGALRRYWAALEEPFLRLVVDLPARGQAAFEEWRSLVRAAAEEAFREVVRSLGESPKAFKAVARAEVQFLGALRGVFQPQ